MTRKDYLEFLAGFISSCDPNNRFLSENNHLIAGNGVLFEYAARVPEIVQGIINEAYRVNATIHSETASEYLEELRAELEVNP